MASFSADLHVADQVFAVLHCAHGVYQGTQERGRANTKVRYGPVMLRLDVPDTDLLVAWAADPHKRLAATIVFRDAKGGQTLETLSLAAYCVAYAETFLDGDRDTGAYVADLTLIDPAGYTIQAGSPAAYVAPAPGVHGAAASGTIGSVLKPTKTGKLKADTPEHKAARWAKYQAANVNNPAMWSQQRWEKQYSANMRNPVVGLGTERLYATAMNAVSKTLKTSLTYRQIDLFIKDERYCGQLKTGKMSLNKQARLFDIPKDAELIKTGYQVEYILEKGASKPFLEALDEAGATYKIGSQLI